VQRLWSTIRSHVDAATLLEHLDASAEWYRLDACVGRCEFLWTRTWLYIHSLGDHSSLYCFPLHRDVRTGVVITSPAFETSGRLWPGRDVAGAAPVEHLPARC
jgi:hypothetical protein